MPAWPYRRWSRPEFTLAVGQSWQARGRAGCHAARRQFIWLLGRNVPANVPLSERGTILSRESPRSESSGLGSPNKTWEALLHDKGDYAKRLRCTPRRSPRIADDSVLQYGARGPSFSAGANATDFDRANSKTPSRISGRLACSTAHHHRATQPRSALPKPTNTTRRSSNSRHYCNSTLTTSQHYAAWQIGEPYGTYWQRAESL